MLTRKQRKQRKPKLKKKNKMSSKSCKYRKQSKKRKQSKQRGGTFFDFIPSPMNDAVRNSYTGVTNFFKTLQGRSPTSSPLPFVQPAMQN